MFCGKCGQGLAEGTAVCPNCGNPVATASSMGAGRLKSTFSGGNANMNGGSFSSADVNQTQTYGTPGREVNSNQSGYYGMGQGQSSAGGSYSGSGYSAGGYHQPVDTTPKYGSTSGAATAPSWGMKIFMAIALIMSVFFLPMTAGLNSTGIDAIEPAFEELGSIFENLDDILENLDNEYVMKFFLAGLFSGFGILMYVFAPFGVLAASIMNSKKMTKSFVGTGIAGLFFLFLGLIIATEGSGDIFDALDYGIFVGLALYIACGVVAGRE